VVGGMMFSMFLTLLVVPVVYTVLARFAERHKATQDVDVEEREKRPDMLPAESR